MIHTSVAVSRKSGKHGKMKFAPSRMVVTPAKATGGYTSETSYEPDGDEGGETLGGHQKPTTGAHANLAEVHAHMMNTFEPGKKMPKVKVGTGQMDKGASEVV